MTQSLRNLVLNTYIFTRVAFQVAWCMDLDLWHSMTEQVLLSLNLLPTGRIFPTHGWFLKHIWSFNTWFIRAALLVVIFILKARHSSLSINHTLCSLQCSTISSNINIINGESFFTHSSIAVDTALVRYWSGPVGTNLEERCASVPFY